MFDSVPATVKLAAKRAFIRTTAQSYAATLTAGLLASVINLIVNPGDWLNVLVLVLLAVLTPPLAGLVAAFQWLGDKIPVEYGPATFESQVQRNLKAQEG